MVVYIGNGCDFIMMESVIDILIYVKDLAGEI